MCCFMDTYKSLFFNTSSSLFTENRRNMELLIRGRKEAWRQELSHLSHSQVDQHNPDQPHPQVHETGPTRTLDFFGLLVYNPYPCTPITGFYMLSSASSEPRYAVHTVTSSFSFDGSLEIQQQKNVLQPDPVFTVAELPPFPHRKLLYLCIFLVRCQLHVHKYKC